MNLFSQQSPAMVLFIIWINFMIRIIDFFAVTFNSRPVLTYRWRHQSIFYSFFLSLEWNANFLLGQLFSAKLIEKSDL